MPERCPFGISWLQWPILSFGPKTHHTHSRQRESHTIFGGLRNGKIARIGRFQPDLARVRMTAGIKKSASYIRAANSRHIKSLMIWRLIASIVRHSRQLGLFPIPRASKDGLCFALAWVRVVSLGPEWQNWSLEPGYSKRARFRHTIVTDKLRLHVHAMSHLSEMSW